MTKLILLSTLAILSTIISIVIFIYGGEDEYTKPLGYIVSVLFGFSASKIHSWFDNIKSLNSKIRDLVYDMEYLLKEKYEEQLDYHEKFILCNGFNHEMDLFEQNEHKKYYIDKEIEYSQLRKEIIERLYTLKKEINVKKSFYSNNYKTKLTNKIEILLDIFKNKIQSNSYEDYTYILELGNSDCDKSERIIDNFYQNINTFSILKKDMEINFKTLLMLE